MGNDKAEAGKRKGSKAAVGTEQAPVQDQAGTQAAPPEPKAEPKVLYVLSPLENEAVIAADALLKGEKRLSDVVNDLIVEYTKVGVAVADMAKRWQEHLQLALQWPTKEGGAFANTTEARNHPAGRVYNTLSARKGKVLVDKNGIAVLEGGKMVWLVDEASPRDPKQPEGPPKDEPADKGESRKAAREEAATVKAASEALGSIAAEVWLLRRELEQLRGLPMFTQLLSELDKHFDTIEAEVKDLTTTLELDPKGVEDAADKAKVANS